MYTEHQKPGVSCKEMWEAYACSKGERATHNRGHLEARCDEKAVRSRESHWLQKETGHRRQRPSQSCQLGALLCASNSAHFE